MKKAIHYSTIALLLFTVFVMAGCAGSYNSVSGSTGYGVYYGYGYPYHRYESYYDRYDDRNVDRDKIQQKRQERVEARPERRQNVQTARSRASSMGRPARMGGRGGRR